MELKRLPLTSEIKALCLIIKILKKQVEMCDTKKKKQERQNLLNQIVNYYEQVVANQPKTNK